MAGVHLAGICQKNLSEEILKNFDRISKSRGLSTVHLAYPGGIKEGRFLKGLREAKSEREAAMELQ
jgi:hypothetical protein